MGVGGGMKMKCGSSTIICNHDNVAVRLTVSGSVHAVRCESVCQANEVLLFGSSDTLSLVVELL